EQCGRTGPGRIVATVPYFRRGVFYEFIYRIVWSPDSRGHVTGWRREADRTAVPPDGGWSCFVEYRGEVGYAGALSYYFKMGVYTTHPFMRPMSVYHRDFEDGPTAAAVGASELEALAAERLADGAGAVP